MQAFAGEKIAALRELELDGYVLKKSSPSCGLERTVSLWTPYTSSSGNAKPLAVLQGHTASVLHVAINDDGFQLFSCSVDKCIKVWDLRSQKCMQTIHDKTAYRPEDRITSLQEVEEPADHGGEGHHPPPSHF